MAPTYLSYMAQISRYTGTHVSRDSSFQNLYLYLRPLMRALELFKGTGSVDTACKTLGYSEVVSLDIHRKYNPSILTDIMDWDYRTFPPGHFDMIWASPPCTQYSTMMNMQIAMKNITREQLEENRKKSDLIVERVLEIIEYYQPRYWFMENPNSGNLSQRSIVKSLAYIVGDYCQYGYPYRKRTRFWYGGTNGRVPKLKLCHQDCSRIVNGRHPITIGPKHDKEPSAQWTKAHLGVIIGPKNPVPSVCKWTKENYGRAYDLQMRYSIPQPLLLELLPRPPRKVTIVVKPRP